VRVSYKGVRRGGDEKAWIVTVSSLNHSHELTNNPLAVYPALMEHIEEFQQVREAAVAYRFAVIPYSASRRVLESKEFALHLSHRQYYNLVRKMKPDSQDQRTIAGLIVALEEHSFLYSTRVKESLDVIGKVVSRELVQIWFSHPSLMTAARRFVADFVLIIDGTFNTNTSKLPLLVAVGILNLGRTFPVAFSWCPAEDRESYLFFWECLKTHCFNPPRQPNCSLMKVILGD
jgi:hypothetical protein